MGRLEQQREDDRCCWLLCGGLDQSGWAAGGMQRGVGAVGTMHRLWGIHPHRVGYVLRAATVCEARRILCIKGRNGMVEMPREWAVVIGGTGRSIKQSASASSKQRPSHHPSPGGGFALRRFQICAAHATRTWSWTRSQSSQPTQQKPCRTNGLPENSIDFVFVHLIDRSIKVIHSPDPLNPLFKHLHHPDRPRILPIAHKQLQRLIPIPDLQRLGCHGRHHHALPFPVARRRRR